MGKIRQEKVASLIQSAIALYLEENKDGLGIDGLVFVDQVFVPADLKSAEVWVSFNPLDDSQRKFELLGKGINRLQSYLFKQMAMKRVPRISLQLSDPERQYKLEKIFDTLESHDQESGRDSDGSQGSE